MQGFISVSYTHLDVYKRQALCRGIIAYRLKQKAFAASVFAYDKAEGRAAVCDDIDIVQYLSPMLTSVHIPVEEMGKMAAKTLIDRICGGHTLPMKIHLPCYLAKRESCDKPRTGPLFPAPQKKVPASKTASE